MNEQMDYLLAEIARWDAMPISYYYVCVMTRFKLDRQQADSLFRSAIDAGLVRVRGKDDFSTLTLTRKAVK